MLLPADERGVNRCARNNAAILPPLVLAIEGDRRALANARQGCAKVVHDCPQTLLDHHRIGVTEASLDAIGHKGSQHIEKFTGQSIRSMSPLRPSCA